MIKPGELKEKMLERAEIYIDNGLRNSFNGRNEISIDIRGLGIFDDGVIQQLKDKYLEGGWNVKYDRGFITLSAKE